MQTLTRAVSGTLALALLAGCTTSSRLVQTIIHPHFAGSTFDVFAILVT